VSALSKNWFKKQQQFTVDYYIHYTCFKRSIWSATWCGWIYFWFSLTQTRIWLMYMQVQII